MSANPTRPIVA